MALESKTQDTEDEGILYRPNVAAILQGGNGEILVAERLHTAGAWQFPQGGIDDGESETEALYREVEEELGIRKELIRIREKKEGYRYRFAGDRVKHGKYRGQQQVYFLCEFGGNDADICLDVEHPEFAQFRWIEPSAFELSWVPEFKLAVYNSVLHDFFGVQL
jgi:putative (di)nucleoside polyphosphate hydrolase